MDDKKREDRTIVISGDINRDIAKTVIEKIAQYNTEDRNNEDEKVGFTPTPIAVVINTYGGSVTDGFAIVGAITTSKTPVFTVCLGKAMSMGFMIFAAGHRRFAHNLSIFMYHEISGSHWGKLQELKDEVEYLDQLMKMYDDFILKHTKITRDKLDEFKNARKDWYLTADDAIKYGLADELAQDVR